MDTVKDAHKQRLWNTLFAYPLQVVAQLRGPVLVSKGPLDVVCDSKNIIVCSTSAGGTTGVRVLSAQGCGTVLCGINHMKGRRGPQPLGLGLP